MNGFEIKYAAELDWCLDHPDYDRDRPADFRRDLLWFRSSAESSCRTWMKALVWVRATMPYTISFEKAARVCSPGSQYAIQYPMVTVTGSELGRPDDGTDPTGFFNCEFYVGLKPYNDKSWGRRLGSHQGGLDRGLQKKLDLSRRDFQFHAARRGRR